jgi:hypothetical protein
MADKGKRLRPIFTLICAALGAWGGNAVAHGYFSGVASVCQ